MKEKALFIFIRYIALIVLGIGNLALFYIIFTPLTIYPATWILNIFYKAYSINNMVFFNGISIKIIPACVAGAAYYFLLGLNLTTRMKNKTRVYSILLLFGVFLALNIIRIVAFSILYYKGFPYFDLAHEAFWYFGSSIMVVGIWLLNIFIFKIKHAPIYDDLKDLIKYVK